MKIELIDIDTPNWQMNIIDVEDAGHLTIASLISQTIEFHNTFIERHHGIQAGTITDLVENINEYK